MKELIVLCENFGTSFSGGSTATAKFIYYLVTCFSKVKVICVKHDGFLSEKIEFITYDQNDSLSSVLKREANEDSIGYGDFYIAKAFIGTGIPFYFHYHDNWPEMSEFSNGDFAKNRIADYQNIFKSASHVFSVSHAKLKFIQNQTNNVSVIRNGLSQPVTKTDQVKPDSGKFRVLMAGNFNVRKYEKAIELFQLIQEQNIKDIEIDVYGNDEDKIISNNLLNFAFVNKKPFQNTISFDSYHLYLNTSLMENLSLSVVDALANHTPVVSFNVGGTAEVLNNKNGALVACYNVEEMLAAIVKIKGNKIKHEFESLSAFNWEIGAKKMFAIMNKEEGLN